MPLHTIRIAKIKKIYDHISVGENVEELELSHASSWNIR